MYGQNKWKLWMYDVDREGGCVMHFASSYGTEGAAIAASIEVRPPGFWEAQKEFHTAVHHEIQTLADNEYGQVFVVFTGLFNVQEAMELIAMELTRKMDILDENTNQKPTNFTSPFNRN